MIDVDLTIAQSFTNKNIDIMPSPADFFTSEKHRKKELVIFSKILYGRNDSFNAIRDVASRLTEVTSDDDLSNENLRMGSLSELKKWQEFAQVETCERCARCGGLFILGECQECNELFERERIIDRLRQ